jgi:hypothetical protein
VANLLARSLDHLEQCPDHLRGMDVGRLREQLRAYREAVLSLKEGRSTTFDRALIPALMVDGIDPQALTAMENEHAAHPLR